MIFPKKIKNNPRKKKLIIKTLDPFFLFIFSRVPLSYCPFELNWVFFYTEIGLSKNLVLNYPFHCPFSLLFHFPLFASFFILTTTTQNPFHCPFSLLFPPYFFSSSFILTTKQRTQTSTLKKPPNNNIKKIINLVPSESLRRELLRYLTGEIYNVERKTAFCASVFGRD